MKGRDAKQRTGASSQNPANPRTSPFFYPLPGQDIWNMQRTTGKFIMPCCSGQGGEGGFKWCSSR